MSTSAADIANRPLVICGMHRSGTSLTASLFGGVGVNLGDRLFGPNVGNSLGYVFVFCKPWDVADSLFRRGDAAFVVDPQLSLDVWLTYNRSIAEFIVQHPAKCVLFEISQLIADPPGIFAAVRTQLNLPLDEHLRRQAIGGADVPTPDAQAARPATADRDRLAAQLATTAGEHQRLARTLEHVEREMDWLMHERRQLNAESERLALALAEATSGPLHRLAGWFQGRSSTGCAA